MLIKVKSRTNVFQSMMNCFQEIVQENMINITHFLSYYSTKYK